MTQKREMSRDSNFLNKKLSLKNVKNYFRPIKLRKIKISIKKTLNKIEKRIMEIVVF